MSTETVLTSRVTLPKPITVWWYLEQSVAVKATLVAVLLNFTELHYELKIGDDTAIVPARETSHEPPLL